jgi:hypothetical protein
MTPEDVRLAVASAECELQLMQEHAALALAVLQRVADGDRSMPQWELHRAREMAETLHRVQQQTDRLRAVVRTAQPRINRNGARALMWPTTWGPRERSEPSDRHDLPHPPAARSLDAGEQLHPARLPPLPPWRIFPTRSRICRSRC